MQVHIPTNDFARRWVDTSYSILEAVNTVGAGGWYVLGNEVRQFESSLAAYWRIRHAVGVASGLDAIELSLRALGCGQGDLVLTSPISAFATPLAILKLGAIPVFVDCDASGLLDLDLAEKLLSARKDIRYMVPVHLYGHSLDMEHLQAIRDRLQVVIVEDCAQSIGASFRGRAPGTAGQAAATSFYPTKNLGALGDGGAVLTSDAELAAHIRRLRDYGQSSKYRHTEIGYNSRLDELQAAILWRVFLPRLSEWTERRRAIAGMYLAGLRNTRLRPITGPNGSSSCCHIFAIVVENGSKDDFMNYLSASGIGYGEHYPVPLVDQPALIEVRHHSSDECQRARTLCHSEVSLPIHPYLSASEVGRIIDACNSWS